MQSITRRHRKRNVAAVGLVECYLACLLLAAVLLDVATTYSCLKQQQQQPRPQQRQHHQAVVSLPGWRHRDVTPTQCLPRLKTKVLGSAFLLGSTLSST